MTYRAFSHALCALVAGLISLITIPAVHAQNLAANISHYADSCEDFEYLWPGYDPSDTYRRIINDPDNQAPEGFFRHPVPRWSFAHWDTLLAHKKPRFSSIALQPKSYVQLLNDITVR